MLKKILISIILNKHHDPDPHKLLIFLVKIKNWFLHPSSAQRKYVTSTPPLTPFLILWYLYLNYNFNQVLRFWIRYLVPFWPGMRNSIFPDPRSLIPNTYIWQVKVNEKFCCCFAIQHKMQPCVTGPIFFTDYPLLFTLQAGQWDYNVNSNG